MAMAYARLDIAQPPPPPRKYRLPCRLNAPPTLVIRAPSRRQRWHAVEEQTAPRQRQKSLPSSCCSKHALRCLQYPYLISPFTSVLIQAIQAQVEIKRVRMAHLPDDSLPSQFDVVVDGTGQEESCNSPFSISVYEHICVLYRVGAEHVGSCFISSWKVSAAH